MKTKAPNHFSIIQKLNYCEITGNRLGLNVHRHSGKVLHFSWNKESRVGSYRNCIARKCCGLPLLLEIILPLKKRGSTGSCNCAFGTVPEVNGNIVGLCFYHFCFFCFCRCRVNFVLEMVKDCTYLSNKDDLLALQ